LPSYPPLEHRLRLDKEIKKVIAGEANLDKVADLATQALEEQTAATQRLADVSEAVEGAIGKKGAAVLGANKQIGGLADASGAASFAILSLGQAFQDSAQFGMGFAQGFRAINNNIQQTFTALALGSIQAGGFNNLLKLMGGSLWGPGGLILGFSALTAGIEFFSTRAQRATKETKLLSDALGESAERAIKVRGITEKQYEFEINSLSKVLSGLETRISLADDLVAREEQLAELQKAYASNIVPATYILSLEQEISKLKAEGVIANGEELEANKAVLEVLKQRLAEAQANQLIQQTLQDLGGQEVEQIKTSADLLADETAEAAKRNNEAGRLPPILDAQVELYKIIKAGSKEVEAAARARELRELSIKAAIDEQNLAMKQRANATGEDGFLPEGDLELGKRLITDTDRAMQRLNKTFQNTAAQGMTQVVSGFAQMAFGGASFSSAILGPLADMAIQLGKIAITTGLTMAKLRFSFANPAAAIAAGVALVAVGSAVKSSIKAAGNGASSASSAASGRFTTPSFGTMSMVPTIGQGSVFQSQMFTPVPQGGQNVQLVASGRSLVSVVGSEMSASSRRVGGTPVSFSGVTAASGVFVDINRDDLVK